MKRCRICGLVKPLSDYYEHATAADGHRSDCIECNKAVKRERYRANVEKNRAVALAWYHRNREHRRTYKERYYAERRAELTTKQREWNAANPELLKKQRARRKVRMRGGAVVEDVAREVVWDRDAGLCGICGEPCDPTDFHVDHVVPISKGGVHAYANVQLAHPFCNRRKAAKLAA